MRARFGANDLLQAMERGGAWLPLGVGLVCRLGLTTAMYSWSAAPTHGDDVSYVHYARVLIQTGELEGHHFPVGYPLFVAFWLKLTGSFVPIRLAHVALSVWTIATVSKIAGRLYGPRAGLLAAWLTALYPPLMFMNGRIMSETLFIAVLTFSLQRLLLSDSSERLWDSVLGGCAFAVSALVRSNLLMMLPFLSVWQLLKPPLKPFAWKKRWVTVVATGAVAGAIILLPGLYFLKVKGEFLPSATNAGQTFYGANNPLADGGWVQMEDHQEYLRAIPPEVRKHPSAYSKAQFALGFAWIRENFGAFLLLLPKKLGNAWVPGFQSSETTSSSPLAFLVLILVNGPLLLAAIVGRRLHRPKERDGLLLAVLVTYTVMSLAFYGNPRIGLFCSPILIVYAASWAGRLERRGGSPEPQRVR